jgi:hypothetical protein
MKRKSLSEIFFTPFILHECFPRGAVMLLGIWHGLAIYSLKYRQGPRYATLYTLWVTTYNGLLTVSTVTTCRVGNLRPSLTPCNKRLQG